MRTAPAAGDRRPSRAGENPRHSSPRASITPTTGGPLPEDVAKAGRADEAIAMPLQLLDDPRRLLKSVPEDFHKTFHRSFFKRLLVYVDEATGEPKASADEIRSTFTPLLPEQHGRSGPRTTNTGPNVSARCSDNAGLAGLIEAYGNLYSQVATLRTRWGRFGLRRGRTRPESGDRSCDQPVAEGE